MAMQESLSLPEKVFLLHVSDEGQLPRSVGIHSDLPQAEVLELGMSGALRIVKDKVHPVPGKEPSTPFLRTAYQTLLGKDSWSLKTDIQFNRLLPGFKVVAGALIERGILREERTKRFGLVPITVYPTNDPAVRQALRKRLRDVLLGTAAPEAHDPALILLMAEDLLHWLIDNGQRSDAEKRASEIVAEVSPEGSFLHDYAKARAKDFWRSNSGISDWLNW